MIIRALRLRHGRLALPKPLTPLKAWPRSLATASTSAAEIQQHAATGSNTYSRSRPPREVRDPTDPVAADFLFFHHQKERTQHLGTGIASHYRPHELLSNPPRPADITLELLMASQAHIGHATSLWHPANAKYIFGVRGDHDPIHIISLETTAAHLRRACKVVRGVAERAGIILFVGTRSGQARSVVRAAQLAGACHLFTRWTAGTITNGQQILGACRKKVVNELDEEVLGFEDQLVQGAALKPDLVVCLNPLENYLLLHECALHNIPTIGIIDTDVNPTWVTYPIPANDDSPRCVSVIAGVLGRAGQEGKEERLRRARQNGEIAYPASHGLRPPTSGQAEKEREAIKLARLTEQAKQQAYMDEGEVVEEDEWQTAEEEVEEAEADLLNAAAPGMEIEQAELEQDLAPEEGDATAFDAETAVDLSALAADADAGVQEVVEAADQPYEVDRPLSDEEKRQGVEADERSQQVHDTGAEEPQK